MIALNTIALHATHIRDRLYQVLWEVVSNKVSLRRNGCSFGVASVSTSLIIGVWLTFAAVGEPAAKP